MTTPTYRLEAIYLTRRGIRRAVTRYLSYMPVLASDAVPDASHILDARITRVTPGVITRQETVRAWASERSREDFIRLTTTHEGGVTMQSGVLC